MKDLPWEYRVVAGLHEQTKAPTYRTTNWHDYNAALARRGSLAIWFDPQTQWLAAPTGKRGCQPVFTDAAIQACLTLKALFGLPLRQATGIVASLLDLAGLDWPVPDFSTLCRRQKTLKVNIPYRASSGALHFLIDSTGVKAEGDGDGEWLTKKHGPSKPRNWRKVHLGIDVETLELRAISPSASSPRMVPTTPAPVTWSSRHPGRRPPFRSARTASPGRSTRPERPRATWPSAVAAALAGPSGSAGPAATDEVWSKPRCAASSSWASASCDFNRQVTELQIRAAILNRVTALGTPITQRTG